MTGHQAILKLRLQGVRPEAVFVHVLDREPTRGPYDAEHAIDNAMHAEIEIGISEVPALLDLRCLRDVGTVNVVGNNEARVRAVARRAVEFSPNRVICCGAAGLIIWSKK